MAPLMLFNLFLIRTASYFYYGTVHVTCETVKPPSAFPDNKISQNQEWANFFADGWSVLVTRIIGEKHTSWLVPWCLALD